VLTPQPDLRAPHESVRQWRRAAGAFV
jgi:hypothetical protein